MHKVLLGMHVEVGQPLGDPPVPGFTFREGDFRLTAAGDVETDDDDGGDDQR